MATNTRYKGFSDLLKVVKTGIYAGQPLDINNNLCSVTGLPNVLKPNNLGDPDYKEPVYDPVTCAATTTTYYSTVKTGSAQKNDCTMPGDTGTTVTLTIPAGTYTSTVSQADADLQATNALNAQLQSNANANGSCIAHTPVYWAVNFGPKVTEGEQDDLTGITGTFSMKRTVAGNIQDLSTKTIDPVNSSPSAVVNVYGFNPQVTSYFVEVNISTNTLTENLVLEFTDFSGTSLGNKTFAPGETGVFRLFEGSEYSGIVVNIDASVVPLPVFTATRSADFQKNNCTGSGETGSFVTFSRNYTSTISQGDADNQAATDSTFNTDGQANANLTGTCFAPLPSDAVGIVVVDIYNFSNLQACGFVDTPGVTPYQDPVYTGQNFNPNDGTPAANCWALASDFVGGGGQLNWRFEFNVARLINAYPSIPQFVFKIRGRVPGANSASASGAYSLKGADAGNMIMNGSPGTYVPSVQNAQDLAGLMNFSGRFVSSGGDGNYGVNYGNDIITLTYTVSNKQLVLS